MHVHITFRMYLIYSHFIVSCVRVTHFPSAFHCNICSLSNKTSVNTTSWVTKRTSYGGRLQGIFSMIFNVCSVSNLTLHSTAILNVRELVAFTPHFYALTFTIQSHTQYSIFYDYGNTPLYLGNVLSQIGGLSLHVPSLWQVLVWIPLRSNPTSQV